MDTPLDAVSNVGHMPDTDTRQTPQSLCWTHHVACPIKLRKIAVSDLLVGRICFLRFFGNVVTKLIFNNYNNSKLLEPTLSVVYVLVYVS